MTPPCSLPALEEDLLDRARAGGRLFLPEQLAHLEACQHCQVAVERARRLAQAWRALAPQPFEIAAARARFTLRTDGRRPRRSAPKLVLAAWLLACGAASAAAGVALKYERTPLSAAGSGPSANPQRVKVGLSANSARAPASSISPAPVPAPVSSQHEPSALPTNARAPQSLRTPPPAGETYLKASAQAQVWARAAAAMRAGNYSAAEAAFGELARAADAANRDAARLARAQVWLAQGRVSAALPELKQLSRSGATSLVRQRANEALSAIR